MDQFFVGYPSSGGGGGGGVTTLNGLSGALSLVAGSGITITPSGSNITIAASGGSGANTALSNLASTAVNTDILPDSNNSHVLGTAGFAWQDVHTASVSSNTTLGIQSGADLNVTVGTTASVTIPRTFYQNNGSSQPLFSFPDLLNNNFLNFSPPNTNTAPSFILPGSDGANGNALTTDGAGNLSFKPLNIFPTRLISGTDTLTTSDAYVVLLDLTSGTFNLTMPPGVNNLVFNVLQAPSNTGTWNLLPNGGDTFDGGNPTTSPGGPSVLVFLNGVWYFAA